MTAARSLPAWLYYGLLLLIAGAFALHENAADRDLWHRLALGQYITEHHALPARDVFSYLSEPTPLHDHEWGCGLLFYTLYRAGGDTALVALKLVLFAATLLLLDAAARFYHKERRPLTVFWFTVTALALVPAYASTVRCLVFTNFFLALWLLWLVRLRAGYHVPVWPFALSAALWANLHGGFVAGLGLIGLYALGEKLNRRPIGMLLRIGVWATVATLFNPYTYHLWISTVRAIVTPRPLIYEWAATPLGDYSYFGFKLLAALLLASALGMVLSGRARRNWDWVGILVSSITLYLAVRHLRHLALFAVLSSLFAYRGWLVLLPLSSSEPTPWISRARAYFSTALLTTIAIVCLHLLQHGDRFTLRVTEPDYPVQAVAFLQQTSLSGEPKKLLVPFNWGSYASWKLFPRYLVSLDGRYELVYSQETYRAVSDFYYNAPGWDVTLQQHPPDAILLPRRSVELARRLEATGRYQPVYSDDTASVYFLAPALK